MTIEIIDPTWDWTIGIVAVLTLGGSLLVAIFLTVMGRNAWNWRSSSYENVWGTFTFIAFCCVVLGLVFMQGVNNNRADENVVAVLEDSGLDHVTYDPSEDMFNASKGGDYFEGILVQIEGSTYQIVEVDR